MNKIWNLSLLCLGALVLIVQTACSDNDSDSREVPQVVPTAQWSQTMAGMVRHWELIPISTATIGNLLIARMRTLIKLSASRDNTLTADT